MYVVRSMQPADFSAVHTLARAIYPEAVPWNDDQLLSHLRVFPEGQFIAEEAGTGRIVGYAASLIVSWNDYSLTDSWRDFTDNGMFTNHDPERGRTLYAADIMVDPTEQGHGVGKLIYQAREELLHRRRLLRIRAGARLQGYHHYHAGMTVEEYVVQVVDGSIADPTLTFQLKCGFKVVGVVHGYMRHDPMSMGYAAVIEFLNDEVAGAEDYRGQHASRYYRP